MKTKPFYIALQPALLAGIGMQQPGTRIFRREGSQAEQAEWFDLICEYVGPCVGVGGVSMYAAVTRTGVYKRINAGQLTAFCFHVTTETKSLFGHALRVKSTPYVYIPVDECRAWKEELEGRFARLEAAADLKSRFAEIESLRTAQAEFSQADENSLLLDPADKGRRISIVKRSRKIRKH